MMTRRDVHERGQVGTHARAPGPGHRRGLQHQGLRVPELAGLQAHGVGVAGRLIRLVVRFGLVRFGVIRGNRRAHRHRPSRRG